MREALRWTGVSLALALAVYFALHAQPQLAGVMDDPTGTFYYNGADAWKNIYTVAYHVVYDETPWLTRAYNYPDGEHIAFADAQPLLANGLRLLGVSSVETSVAAVQLAPLVGVWIGAILLAWLFVRLRLPLLLAALAALGIALLSPQVTRVTGHFGLSYVFVLPALLHPLLSWARRPGWAPVGTLVVLLFLAGQLHLYNLAIGLALCSLSLGWYALLYQREPAKLGLTLAQLAVLVGGSFGATKWVLALVRADLDRPGAPYGLAGFNTTWEGLIVDKSLPWWGWAQEYLFKVGSTGSFEGRGYLGIVAGLFLLYLLFGAPLRAPYGKTILAPEPHPGDRRFLLPTLLAGLVCGLLALGFPFSIDRFAWVADYIGVVRQFRTIGRFVWVTYYTLEVAAIVYLYALFWRKPKWAWVPYVAALVIVWEGTRHLATVEAYPDTNPYGNDYRAWDEAIGDPTRYQAVLPLPYQHIGSENMNAELGGAGQFMNSQLSLRTGLPNMSVMMSRQGLTESLARLPVGYPWGTVPPVFESLPNEKPILLAVSQLDRGNWSDAGVDPDVYDTWLSLADTLYANSRVVLASFVPSRENLTRVTAAACGAALDASAVAVVDSLPAGVAFYPLVGTGWQLPAAVDTGAGRPLGAVATGSELVTLGSWDVPAGAPPGDYKLSAWLWTGGDGYAGTQVTVDEVDPATDATRVWRESNAVHGQRHHEGQWTLIDWILPLPAAPSRIRIRAKPNRHPNVRAAYVRNLLVRPVGEHVAWEIERGWVIDNVLFDGCRR